MRPPDTDSTIERMRAAIDAGDGDEIDRLGEILDGLEERTRTPQLLASALWYAQHGLRVFPLQPGEKRPLVRSHGCKDATTDADAIRAWWGSLPDANVGIATGHLVDVVDIDGPQGNASWARSMFDDVAAPQYAGPDVIGIVSTPRAGGRHLYVSAESGRGNRANLLPGVDYRGSGGYVVVPPSHTELGIYSWVRPLRLAGAHDDA